jgi:hypothetical protein
MHIRQTDREKSDYNKIVCLSVLYTFSFVRDFENVAYRLSPITSTYTKWMGCLYFLMDWNKILSVWVLCFVVCLSVLYTFSFVRDFENVAYLLSPITSKYTKWVECLHFLVDWNNVLSVWVLCFVVSQSVLYTFSFVRDFENVAYRLSPITSTYTKWVEYAYTYSMSSAVMGTYLFFLVIKGDFEIYLLNNKLFLCP